MWLGVFFQVSCGEVFHERSGSSFLPFRADVLPDQGSSDPLLGYLPRVFRRDLAMNANCRLSLLSCECPIEGEVDSSPRWGDLKPKALHLLIPNDNVLGSRLDSFDQ